VISGAGRDDRSGDVAANLAAALAAKGSRVILLDADSEGRHVTTVLGLEDRAGLGELLTSAGERPPVADIAVERSRHLSVIAVGAEEGHQLIDARRAARVLDRVLENADMVVVSAGAAASSASALAWARCSDGTVILARREGTRRDELQRAKEALSEVGAPILGTALADRPRLARLKLRRVASITRGARPRVSEATS
jgi:receptor protein-tyrosine kinase